MEENRIKNSKEIDSVDSVYMCFPISIYLYIHLLIYNERGKAMLNYLSLFDQGERQSYCTFPYLGNGTFSLDP